MTTMFGQLSNRLIWAKRFLLIATTVTVFALVASVALGVKYFAFKRDVFKQQKQILEDVRKTDRLLPQIYALEESFKSPLAKNLASKEAEAVLLSRLTQWGEVQLFLANLNFPVEKIPKMQLLAHEPATFTDLKRDLAELKEKKLAQLETSVMDQDMIHKEFIWIGLAVLVFGFLAPFFVIRFATAAIKGIREELEKAAYDIVKTWSMERAKFGDSAFKNVEFWTRILLILGHHAGRTSNHPVAQVAGEVAHIVQKEIARLDEERRAS